MSRVTITPGALAELRERVAREPFAAGVIILGPTGPNSLMAESAEEARDLEIAYGAAPKWVMHIIHSSKLLEQLTANAHFLMIDIDGLRVAVAGAKSDVSLLVELHGDSIRISEQ